MRPATERRGRVPPAVGLPVVAVVLIAAAVTVMAVVRDEEPEAPTTITTGVDLTGYPPAPWRSQSVPRHAVPEPYAEAWDRAANRWRCPLLFPLSGGPELEDAKPSAQRTPEDRGWDIFLTGKAGSIEVLGLFEKDTQVDKPLNAPSYTQMWSDGSVAKYSPDVGNAAPGTYDPKTSPYEALLTLSEDECVYRIYDTLGRDHLEAVFNRLRQMIP